jgi:hypothetical protein
MSYRIEQNDNDIFFILYMKTSFLFTIKDRSAKYLVKKKITKNVPVQVILTGKNQWTRLKIIKRFVKINEINQHFFSNQFVLGDLVHY